ncbi:MAG: DUF2970 domain-containing protein [Burkholderiales bacterium]|nr:DUF2970 domain-containing protein [Burkholderiales bacterium]
MSDDGGQDKASSVMQMIKAVAWGFFGVRKGADHAQDVARIKPTQIIVAGLIAAVMFVAVLVLLVRWVVNSGVAH